MPRCRTSGLGSVRHSTKIWLARWAAVVQIFCPVIEMSSPWVMARARALVWLAEALAVAVGPVDDVGDEVLPLRLGAVHQDGRPDPGLALLAENPRHVGPQALLVNHPGLGVAQVAAAVPGRPLAADQALVEQDLLPGPV